jgi:micrococcal nuclease
MPLKKKVIAGIAIVILVILVLVGAGSNTPPQLAEQPRQIVEPNPPQPGTNVVPFPIQYDCASGCYSGMLDRIIDGDTIVIDTETIRFSLVDTPEIGEAGYKQARDLIASICPVGSEVVFNKDDMQLKDTYGRTLATVYCNGINLNELVLEKGLAEILTFYCFQSEFALSSWAQKYGCGSAEIQLPVPTVPPITPAKQSCDPSYQDVCIPSPPPDLDCGEISYKNFKVVGSDPHRFDGDGDGIGCES